ncbi:MAG: hypothetical protein K6G03_00295 [Lachnospiraceae bacterium]|nr:hypothetical protein [Lachnospiraceae bacterium]
MNCKKEYDFEPLAVSGKENLICPVCGNIIDKNSRGPGSAESIENTEEAIGNATARILHFCYIFYMLLGVAGVVSYFLGASKILYGVTLFALIVFIIQFLTGYITFRSGIIFLPIGAVLGFVYFKTIDGACLGIHLVFLIRHIIRDIIYTIILRLLGMLSGK